MENRFVKKICQMESCFVKWNDNCIILTMTMISKPRKEATLFIDLWALLSISSDQAGENNCSLYILHHEWNTFVTEKNFYCCII